MNNHSISQKTILIIEDDAAIRQMYAMKLRLSGFTVHEATNGEEGIESAERLLPDIILLDLKMPKMSGDEMLIKLREQTWGQDIKVVILTNISKNEAPGALRFLHVSRYIVKAHTTPAQLLEILNEINS